MQPEDIDKLFREQLRNHAPAPPAYLWNQLEAELQPAKKRPVMWLYAAAAVVALLLVAGGSWLWQTPGAPEGTLATSQKAQPAPKAASVSGNEAIAEKTSTAQATTPTPAPSTLPEANRAEQLVAAAAPDAPETTTRPAAPRAPVAPPQPGGSRPATRRQGASAEQQPAAQAFAKTTTARPERPVVLEKAPETLPRPEATALAATAPAGTIEIEVRRGGAAPTVALADASEATERQPRLVGRLLRKAGSAALREARENLPKVELPVVTVNVLNHSLSTKDIQL